MLKAILNLAEIKSKERSKKVLDKPFDLKKQQH